MRFCLFMVSSFGRQRKIKWDYERLEQMKDLLMKGHSVPSVADYFGSTPGAVQKVLSTHGIRPSEWIGRTDPRSPEAKLNRANTKMLSQRFSSRKSEDAQGPQDLVSRMLFLKGETKVRPEAKRHFVDADLKRWLGWFSKIERINLHSSFSLSEIKEYATDEVLGVKLFCEEVLGIELQKYQLQMVYMMQNYKRNICSLGRQAGKDFTISCYALWLGTCQANRKMLIVSPAQRQSDLLFDRMKTLLARSDELFDSIENTTAEVLEFKNGSKIYSLPSTSYIRGFTEVTDVFMNEVAHGIDEEAFSAVEPMLSRLNGGLHLFSSPAGCDGKFWECWNNPTYHKLHCPSTVNKFLSLEWFEECKKTMSSVKYDTEINANFSENMNNFFGSDLIKACTEDYNFLTAPNDPDVEFYMGIDWGRIKDQTTIVIVSKNKFHEIRVEFLKGMEKTPFVIQIGEILRAQSIFHCKRVIPEYAGLSLPLCERLRIEGLPVLYFKPTIDEKEKAYDYLLVNLEKGLIMLPKHDKLLYEMRTFRYELTSQGKKKLHHMDGSSDDFVDALCYAVWGSRITDASFHLAGVRSSAN